MNESLHRPGRQSVRMKIPARLAGLLDGRCDREERLRAVRGQLDLTDAERLILLIVLARSGPGELAGEVRRALETFPAGQLQLLAVDPTLQPGLLAFIARHFAFRHGLEFLLLANPSLPEALRPQLEAAVLRRLQPPPPKSGAGEQGGDSDGAEDAEEESENLTKYQQALQMGVADKIKAALTGDKEWRKLLINDPNKLVSSAVLKNPRISEGEVYTVARNRSANDELIRIILLNREWLKNYNIKLALVMHPRTPVGKALRFMGGLTEKDLGNLVKSREISRVISNNARRLLMNKEKQR